MKDPCRLLVVDDEPNLRAVLAGLLEREGYAVVEAEDGESACERLQRTDLPACAAVLTDLRMPRLDGLGLLRWVRRHRPELPVVLLTAHGTVEDAVEAMREGAHDFVSKPVDPEELTRIIGAAVASRTARDREVQDAHPALTALVGSSDAMERLRERIAKIGPTPSNVLVLGETGTGKELVARALHETSHRADGPYIPTNCAALPESLVEAELFGHEKGAFTGAVVARPGRFEVADGGTLFLDELGDMSATVQPKILRALEQREVQRVGSQKSRTVDVRFVAATHPTLLERVEEGTFRRDLYYRIGVLTLEIPPLRERMEDLPELVAHFVNKHAQRMGTNIAPASDAVLDALGRHTYPGNVRELENLVEGLVVLSEGGVMRASDLPGTVGSGAPSATRASLPKGPLKDVVRDAVAEMERGMIERSLDEHDGNVTHTAAALGLSRKGLQLKMREYALRRGDDAS